MEYAKRGTLFHVLSDKKLVIDWDKGFKFMIETVAGMSYLHTCKPPVFHRDMKSLNILVTKDWEVKVYIYFFFHFFYFLIHSILFFR